MPEQPLIHETRGVQPQGTVAWFGKLPSLGDFVGRRMPHALTAEWDAWLRSGMDEFRALNGNAWSEKFVNAPLWFFVAPAAVTGTAVIGGPVDPHSHGLATLDRIAQAPLNSDRLPSLPVR